jgi:hypothetical protein
LPVPLGPTRPTQSPGCRARSTCSNNGRGRSAG